jgi:flagellar hook-associated protein 1 FlgK
MSNLFASLRSSTSSLDAITQAVAITQNNITNAGSAGYAKQRVTLQALQFDPQNGLAGGVTNGKLASSRDEFVERAVRMQEGKSAAADKNTVDLTKLEQVLQLSSGDSIPSSLNGLYQSFSAWAAAPRDQTAKSTVLTAAANVASSFNLAARKFSDVASGNASEIRSTVDEINRLAGRIQNYNEQVRSGAVNDAGVDAGIHATLEELSANANVEAARQEDGTYTLLLGGEHPLVIGTNQYTLSVSFDLPSSPAPLYPDGAPQAQILTSTGQNITASVKDSKLGAQLDFRHNTLASVAGDAMHEGSVNRLAKKIAGRINEAWPPPSQPFFITGASPASIAETLSVNPALDPAMLDAAEPGPPPVENGKALQLAALGNPQKDNDKLDGRSFNEFYGQIAATIGGKLNDAKFDKQSQTQLSAQVKAFRDQISGVSLDEEAVHLIEFQRAYQASARMVSAIDEMMEIAVNLGR